eukprot:849531-Alexandrium_andersonii.AAC.1
MATRQRQQLCVRVPGFALHWLRPLASCNRAPRRDCNWQPGRVERKARALQHPTGNCLIARSCAKLRATQTQTWTQTWTQT